ncbi:MAG TPA: hypothetical protein VGR28_00285 [Candidatus Thermoplasmatota archaeon]|nr:hypothetical protein [Candidatus Thermoplasmatota archaeon]
MDPHELRLEKIRITLRTSEHLIELQARRHVAVLAVAITVGASSVVAGAAQPSTITATSTVAASMLLVSLTQFWGLRKLTMQRRADGRDALTEVDSLIAEEDEADVDAETDQG